MADELNWLSNDNYEPINENEEVQNEETEKVDEQEATEETTTEETTEEVVSEEKPEKEEGKEEPQAEDKTEEGEEVSEEEPQEEDTEEVSEPDEEKRSLNEESEIEEEEYDVITGASIVEELNDAVASTYGEDITLSDVIEFQNKDFDNMDEFALIEEHFYLQEPDITDKELRFEMKKFDLLKKSEEEIEEMIEDGELTRDDFESTEIAFIRAAKKARADLKEFQSEVNINDLEIRSQASPQQAPQLTQEEIEEQTARFEESFANFKELKVQVGTEKEPHELTLDVSKDVDSLRESIQNNPDGSSWITRRWFDDGVLNIDKLLTDIYKSNNYDRDMATAFAQGAETKLSQEVKDIDNIDFGKGQSKGTPDDGLSEAARIVREIN
jgi:hypothetical protein